MCIKSLALKIQFEVGTVFCHFLLISILEITGKSLFFMIFRSSPKKLWITLLKTLPDASQSLEK